MAWSVVVYDLRFIKTADSVILVRILSCLSSSSSSFYFPKLSVCHFVPKKMAGRKRKFPTEYVVPRNYSSEDNEDGVEHYEAREQHDSPQEGLGNTLESQDPGLDHHEARGDHRDNTAEGDDDVYMENALQPDDVPRPHGEHEHDVNDLDIDIGDPGINPEDRPINEDPPPQENVHDEAQNPGHNDDDDAQNPGHNDDDDDDDDGQFNILWEGNKTFSIFKNCLLFNSFISYFYMT